jgi:branched-chain amino acid transport system substrate-binding protein
MRGINMTRFFIIAMLLILTISFASVIKIGVILPLTGSASIEGVDSKLSIGLANTIFNKVSNYSLELCVRDNHSDPLLDKAETFDLITNNNVKVLIGWIYSSHAFGGTPIAEKYKIPGVCIYATNPLITQGKKYISRVVVDDNFQGKAAAYYIFKSMKIKRIEVVRDVSQEYSIGLASIFESNFRSLGGEIIRTYNIDSSNKNQTLSVKRAMKNILSDGATAIYMPIYSEQIANFLKRFHEAKKTVFMFASDAAGFVTNYLEDKSLANGLYYTDQYFVNYKDKNKMAKMFDNEYYKKYKTYPKNVSNYLAFDAYYLVYNAIKDCIKNNKKPTSANINYFIRHTKNLLASTGHLTINPETGEVLKPIYVLRYSNGKQIFVYKIHPTLFYGDEK